MDSMTINNILLGLTGFLIVIILFLISYVYRQKSYYKQILLTQLQDQKLALSLENEEKINFAIEKNQLQVQKEFSIKELELTGVIIKLQQETNQKLTALEQKEQLLDIAKITLQKEQEQINQTKKALEQSILDFKKNKEQELQKITNLSKEEATVELKSSIENQLDSELNSWLIKKIDTTKQRANKLASEVVALAVQRCSSEVANEHTVTNIKLSTEADKGKIIGKGGRNIQWLEKTLGVEILIDDANSNIISVSGFSTLRRQIAKRTLELLIEDGRIHPASIETMYDKAKSEISDVIDQKGEWAVSELGIVDFPPKLVRLIGRLYFRTSYGQNMLKHSVEMAKIAKLMATEMNHIFAGASEVCNVDICTKGALLHDIGKAVDEDKIPKGNHIDLGEKICDMFDLDWKIKKCVSSHHDESYYTTTPGSNSSKQDYFCIEAAIVDACDNISGGRIGARKETIEAYYQRMEALEKIANTAKGVTKTWIMRGSRELWVFFNTEQISSANMRKTTKEIATRIQTGVKFPGEIKVIGFWEDKAIEYAV
jgi:ribonucrease Y